LPAINTHPGIGDEFSISLLTRLYLFRPSAELGSWKRIGAARKIRS
jgi:hypothetical protein